MNPTASDRVLIADRVQTHENVARDLRRHRKLLVAALLFLTTRSRKPGGAN